MMQFEIQDETGVLFRGSPLEAIRIWEAISFYRKNMQAEFVSLRHLIPFSTWQGTIKMVSILQEFDYSDGVHAIE